MSGMYYATIYAKLETPDRRDDWLLEHGVGQSIPNGGPVFSYSCDDESKYRDLAQTLAEALENMIDAIHQTDWKNGVTDTTGMMDEGEYRVGNIVDQARQALKEWKE